MDNAIPARTGTRHPHAHRHTPPQRAPDTPSACAPAHAISARYL